jgi:hypothetical protein
MAGRGLSRCDHFDLCLGSMISRPVLLIAESGRSNQWIAGSQQEFHRHWGPPWLELVCWTEPVRFSQTLESPAMGIWNLDQWPQSTPSPLDPIWQTRSLEARSEFLARSPRTRELTWSRAFHTQSPSVELWGFSQWQDRADQHHPGPVSVRQLAQRIAEEIYSI